MFVFTLFCCLVCLNFDFIFSFVFIFEHWFWTFNIVRAMINTHFFWWLVLLGSFSFFHWKIPPLIRTATRSFVHIWNYFINNHISTIITTGKIKVIYPIYKPKWLKISLFSLFIINSFYLFHSAILLKFKFIFIESFFFPADNRMNGQFKINCVAVHEERLVSFPLDRRKSIRN